MRKTRNQMSRTDNIPKTPKEVPHCSKSGSTPRTHRNSYNGSAASIAANELQNPARRRRSQMHQPDDQDREGPQSRKILLMPCRGRQCGRESSNTDRRRRLEEPHRASPICSECDAASGDPQRKSQERGGDRLNAAVRAPTRRSRMRRGSRRCRGRRRL